MKIIKENINNIQKLTLVEDANETEVIKDPASAAIDEIAEIVQDGVEAESNGQVVLTDTEAKEVAQDTKEIAQKVEAEVFVPSVSTNELTMVLDEALSATLNKKDEEELFGSSNGESYNVLVSGLPGSGKTAIVKQWARANNINLCYVDAKNDDLEAFINGFTVRDNRYPDKNRITKGSSDGLAALERERSVLFLDELNRQTKRQIRASLLTLINEHRITGDNDNPDDEGGYHYFKNLLFTIACINPALPTERGADELDDAEDSRFALKVDFDSNIETALDFFSKVYKDKYSYIEKLGSEKIKEKFNLYKALKLQESLALYIVSHRDFTFDTRDDLDDLQPYGSGKRRTLFNMRMLTQGIEFAKGEKDKFLKWVEVRSQFRPDVIKMLQDILKFYEDPEIKLPGNIEVEEDEIEISTGTEIDNLDADLSKIDLEDEVDGNLFQSTGGSSTSSTKTVISPLEARNRVNNFNF